MIRDFQFFRLNSFTKFEEIEISFYLKCRYNEYLGHHDKEIVFFLMMFVISVVNCTCKDALMQLFFFLFFKPNKSTLILAKTGEISLLI